MCGSPGQQPHAAGVVGRAKRAAGDDPGGLDQHVGYGKAIREAITWVDPFHLVRAAADAAISDPRKFGVHARGETWLPEAQPRRQR